MPKNGQPATKADLNALEQRLEQRFEGKIDAVEQRILDRVSEMIRDAETNLLQAFYSFAQSNGKRMIQMEANDALFIARFGTLESRVLEIERRLNIPPAS